MPEIIAGEALVCGPLAWIAVYHVYQRNQTFYGWSDDVPLAVRLVTAIAGMLPDTSRGARFIFSRADLKQQKVLKLIAGKSLKAQYDCRGPYALFAF